MWPPFLSTSKNRQTRISLSLEPLEERCLLNGALHSVTTSASNPTPPLLAQITLPNVLNQINGNLGAMPFALPRNVPARLRPDIDSPPQASPPASSWPPPSSLLQAAFILFIDGFDLGVGKANQYFGIPDIYAFPAPIADLNASIEFYSSYEEPWAPLFVLAGEIVGAAVQYQVQINSFQTF